MDHVGQEYSAGNCSYFVIPGRRVTAKLTDSLSYLSTLNHGEIFMVVFMFGIVTTATWWPKAGEHLAMLGSAKPKDDK